MPRWKRYCWSTLILLLGPVWLHAQPLIRHDLRVTLRPHQHGVQVHDTMTLPGEAGTVWRFGLHAGLHPVSETPGVRLERHPGAAAANSARVPVESYTLRLPAATRTVTVSYGGTIRHPLPARAASGARSFRTTPGTIDSDGVYLSGATYWYPQFDGPMLTFALEVELPEAWDAVSQGERTRHERDAPRRRVRWEASTPQEQIFLIGGTFTEYAQPAGRVEAMAFLRTPDEQLAQKYLDATAQYLAMYSKLLGPYPYGKFALVENVWESGYGMPSFTLLGSRVIRFPFILHSSYPHEILHNWWGNGVFVHQESGNWSEGLTAYLADHLVKEQRGQAVAYRRTTLQKYADYVAAHEDFPLNAFQARHNAATEAVGYGKALMFFHMLRQQVGDAAFIRALQRFYRTQRFRRAAYDDLRQAFTDTAGIDLRPEFAQWIDRAGAPELRLSQATVRSADSGYVLDAVVEQVQPGPVYSLHLPVAVTLRGEIGAHQTTLPMTGRRLNLSLHVASRPVRLDIDAQFDLFRRLHRQEIPPALSQMFGAKRAVLLLPSAAPAGVQKGYRRLAQDWQRDLDGELEVRWDRDFESLPADRAVWLCGWENRWRPQLHAVTADYALTLNPDSVRIETTELQRATHAVVLTARHPRQAQLAIGWIAADNPAALPGLGRKLPHYGKYSYVAFTGNEPTNVLKGQWPVLRSPMAVFLPQEDGRTVPVRRGQLAPRQALASLPPRFSATRMQQTIDRLAGPEMRGRGFGTPELKQAAAFLAAQFRAAGLRPAGDLEGSYFQTWQARGGEPERQVELQNVIGIIPGRKAAWNGQSVVIGAHYDHLGHGWPDVHAGDAGKVHPGADDNASGIAVLLELARGLGKSWQPDRTVIFAAFAGEEAGRLGSRYYVTHATRFPMAQCLGMLNLDTVGRLGANKLMVLGTASAREWPHIFHGVGYVTGVAIELAASAWGGSDQRSFLEAGVPAVQLFSGTHNDYHRPTDTPDKIDAEGLRKVAAVARETIVYLAGRQTPLTSRPGPEASGPAVPPPAAAGPRRVSLGTVPDFTYQGRGYRIGGVRPNSPAARAGLQVGDIIVRLDETPIRDMRTFATRLKQLQPGDRIELTFKRGERQQRVQAQVVAR